jgi:hypothetical protein
MFIGLFRHGPNGLMDIYPARDQKGIMKYFIPLGVKGYNETFCAVRDQIARDMYPLRGQDIVKIDPGGVACSD